MAVYRRTVRASLDRVWENVLDWEHLPWLHRGSFSHIEVQQAGVWGWRADLVTSRGKEFAMELLVERDASRYVSRTLRGEGAGSEIWTQLRARAPHETDIEVEFLLPDIPADAVDSIGQAFTRLYTGLWDEDEEMMREREVRLVSRRAAADAPLSGLEMTLGEVEALRARLPLRMEFAGEPIWLVELDGEIVSHTAVCPHSLGPLPAAGQGEDLGSAVQCPWHGHRFDVRTGESCQGHALRMKSGPRVVVEDGELRLLAGS